MGDCAQDTTLSFHLFANLSEFCRDACDQRRDIVNCRLIDLIVGIQMGQCVRPGVIQLLLNFGCMESNGGVHVPAKDLLLVVQQSIHRVRCDKSCVKHIPNLTGCVVSDKQFWPRIKKGGHKAIRTN